MQEKFTDAAGNNNSAIEHKFTSDSTPPTMTITAKDQNNVNDVNNGDTTNDNTLKLTFTSSKTTTTFVKSDINFGNGDIGTLSGSGSAYTATFTPTGDGNCTIDVPSGVYTDAFGNNNSAATQFVWIRDTVSPTVTLSYSSNGIYKQGDTAVITATFNEAMATSPVPKITINWSSGSEISNVTAQDMTRTSSTVYTYSYTVPAGNGTGTITLSNGTDVAGNTLTTPTSNNTFTVDNTAPTGDLTFGSDGPYKQGDTVNIFVTFSEDMADTPTPQITITGANGSGISTTTITMSKFGSSARDYSADYTVPSGDGNCTITFTNGTDLAGNTITTTPQQNSTFTIDNTPPTMTITAKGGTSNNTVSSGATTADTTLSLTFTSSETTSNFSSGDITVTNGAISNFGGSGTTYTATFTPTSPESAQLMFLQENIQTLLETTTMLFHSHGLSLKLLL